MKTRIFKGAAIFCFIPTLTFAATVQFQTPACISDDLLHEFGRYIIDEDSYGMMQLIENGDCTVLRYGDQVSVVKRGFTDAVIRYEGFKLHVPVEAIAE